MLRVDRTESKKDHIRRCNPGIMHRDSALFFISIKEVRIRPHYWGFKGLERCSGTFSWVWDGKIFINIHCIIPTECNWSEGPTPVEGQRLFWHQWNWNQVLKEGQKYFIFVSESIWAHFCNASIQRLSTCLSYLALWALGQNMQLPKLFW